MAKENEVVLNTGEKIESIGPWRIAWRKFRANKVAMAGLIIFILIVLSVIFVPMILGIDVNDFDFAAKNQHQVLHIF